MSTTLTGTEHTNLSLLQDKLELQYAAKRNALLNEVADLKQQLEERTNETRTLNASIDSLKSVNEELKVMVTSHGRTVLMCIFYSAHLP